MIHAQYASTARVLRNAPRAGRCWSGVWRLSYDCGAARSACAGRLLTELRFLAPLVVGSRGVNFSYAAARSDFLALTSVLGIAVMTSDVESSSYPPEPALEPCSLRDGIPATSSRSVHPVHETISSLALSKCAAMFGQVSLMSHMALSHWHQPYTVTVIFYRGFVATCRSVSAF